MSWGIDKLESAASSIGNAVSTVWEATRSLHEFVIGIHNTFVADGLKVIFSDVLAPILKPIFDLIGIEDKDVYSIEVVTVPLIDQEASYFKNSIMTSVRNGSDLPNTLRNIVLSAQRSALNNYVSYGKNHFIDGAPEATVSEYFIDRDAVTQVLENIVGQPITITSLEFTNPDKDLWTHYDLVTNFGYTYPVTQITHQSRLYDYDSAILNAATTHYSIEASRTVSRTARSDDHTIIDSSSGTEHTITYTIIHYVHTWPEGGTPTLSTQSGQISYTDTITSTGAPDSHTIVTGTPSAPSNVLYSTVVPDVTTVPNPGAYYHAVYTIDATPADIHVWYYHTLDNTYPELNNPIGGSTDSLNMTPVITLREEFVNIDVDPLAPRAVSSQKLLDRLNMGGLSSFTDSLVDEDNPNDISNIQDAFLVFGVNIYTTEQNSLKYLFNYFMMLSALPKFDKTSFLALPEMDKSNSNFIFRLSEGR